MTETFIRPKHDQRTRDTGSPLFTVTILHVLALYLDDPSFLVRGTQSR